MNKYIEKLQNLIAAAQLEDAFQEFNLLLAQCREQRSDAEPEIAKLRREMLMASSTHSDFEKRFRQNLISLSDYSIASSKVRYAFLQLVEDLKKHPTVYEFLEDLEEEEAWEIAVNENSIAAYEKYFEQYPKGKYISDSQRIINELKEKIKTAAQAEKNRRQIMKDLKIRDAKPKKEPTTNLAVDDLRQWWQTISPDWQQALKHEIGAIGEPTEQQLMRILNLKMIDVSNNRNINTVAPLRHLHAISNLNLSRTTINDLQPLSTLPNLKYLDISKTNVQTIRPLFQLKKLRSLSYSVLNQGELIQLKQHLPKCRLIER